MTLIKACPDCGCETEVVGVATRREILYANGMIDREECVRCGVCDELLWGRIKTIKKKKGGRK